MTDLDDIPVAGRDVAGIDDDVLLYGPPGTGKTTQAARRVVELLETTSYEMDDVCWVTYRRDLAQQTLDDLVAYGLLDEHEFSHPRRGKTRWLGTMHAVGYRLAGDELGSPADTDDKEEFAYHHNLPYDPAAIRTTPGELLFNTFHWLHGQRLDPANPRHAVEAPALADLQDRGFDRDIPSLYEDWQQYLGDDLCEFADMLKVPLDEEFTPPTKILVLDELHDFNRLMLDTAMMWANAADVVIAAGDPDQVINWFDGARRGHFDDVREELGLDEVLLDTSYRVFSTAGNIADHLLANAHRPPPVTQQTTGMVSEYRSPTFQQSGAEWSVPDPDDPASPVWLCDRHSTGSTMYLARTRAQVQALCQALDQGGVLYHSQNDFNGWRDTLLLRLHNALQKLTTIDRSSLGAGAGNQSLKTYQTSGKPPAAVEFLPQEVIALLDRTPASYLDLSRGGMDSRLDDLDHPTASIPTGADIQEWVSPVFWDEIATGAAAVRELNKTGSVTNPTLHADDRSRLRRALVRYDQPVSADDIDVSVLTIHAAKGKQADDVVLYDGITSRIRTQMNQSSDVRENEWRTWYVAVTRAAERLHILRDAFEWTSSIIPTDARQIAANPAATTGGEAE